MVLHSDGPSRIVYDVKEDDEDAWIVEVPGATHRGEAYALSPAGAAGARTPDAVESDTWDVWWCSLRCPIKEGTWQPATDFSIRLLADGERPSSPLLRTHTARTAALSDSLDYAKVIQSPPHRSLSWPCLARVCYRA